MNRRPNIVFLMSDQHNAGSLSCAGHPNVRTPHLDALAADGVLFQHAYCNNPICSPSRLCFVTGQYCHTHGYVGNNNFEAESENSNTLGATLRSYGYQTALVGKGHMIRKWDNIGYEHIRYCDLCDADRNDLRKHHYYNYLIEHGLADRYEDGTLPPGHPCRRDGCAVADLPYEHSIEHWTGEESLAFLKARDRLRPFFLHMSFERPHPNWMPSAEHADLYDPSEIELGPDFVDWWENQWAGRPDFITRSIANRMRNRELADLKKMLAYHFALVTVIDMEIGRVIQWLKDNGEYENTIIVYSADHGDFAGDHGTCDKNVGIYESIHRIPFILACPGGPESEKRQGIIESVDMFPTLCELAEVPVPGGLDGRSIVPELEGRGEGKARAICEWDFPAPQRRVNAIRTPRYRLVYYSHQAGGELYDHETDPYEMCNQWDNPEYREARIELLELLFDEVNLYCRRSDFDTDAIKNQNEKNLPRYLVHKKCKKWSEVQELDGE